MRLPKIKDLTDEQKQVYLYAPQDKHVLVHGPPGTGKTLIACLRAVELKKRKVPVVLGMFNRVLAQYSANVGEGMEMPSHTVHVWFRNWWKDCSLPPHPATPRKIAIQVDFEDRERAKRAGAIWHPHEWRPWGRRKGVWMVDAEHYFANQELFECWKLWHDPPVIDGNYNRIDWDEVGRHLLENEDDITDSLLEFGAVLIDEGQDFPEDFYKFLRKLSILASAPGRKIVNPLKAFILADENQQITEENSTLDQISEALKIEPNNRYLLLDNFRNSQEIAELARQFFADVGVLPKLPKRSSEKPCYTIVGNNTNVIERIKIWLINNPRKEVGVFVFDENKRETIFSELKRGVASLRGGNITVQTYSWNTRGENPPNALVFDTPDVVTVLNMQSCKGLEFDAVFIVDLHEAKIGLYGPDRFKMQMFVAVSRGRDWVQLIDSGPSACKGAYTACLPGDVYLEREELNVSPKRNTLLANSLDKGPDKSSSRSKIALTESTVSSDWHARVVALAKSEGLQVSDNREKGGALWVYGGRGLEKHLKPLDFTYSEKRSGWWRK